MYKIPVKLTKAVLFDSHWVCLFGKIYLAAPQSSCCSPWAAAPSWAASVGYPWAAVFKLCTLLYHGLLHGCMGRSVLCGARGLQEDGLLRHGPPFGCRELLLHAWSSSCLLCAWLLLFHFTLLSLTVFFYLFSNMFPFRCHYLAAGPSPVVQWGHWNWPHRSHLKAFPSQHCATIR